MRAGQPFNMVPAEQRSEGSTRRYLIGASQACPTTHGSKHPHSALFLDFRIRRCQRNPAFDGLLHLLDAAECAVGNRLVREDVELSSMAESASGAPVLADAQE